MSDRFFYNFYALKQKSMINSKDNYALDIKISKEIGSLKVKPGELVYSNAPEGKLKTGIIQSLGFGQMSMGESQNTSHNLKHKISLIFPELLFLNELSLKDNLKVYFDSTQKGWDQNTAMELFEEYKLDMNAAINSLTLLQKIDFLICRAILSKSEIIVLDSSILQLDEYDQDRIMAELIMHCRESRGTLLVTQYSERLVNGFPGRVFGEVKEEQEQALEMA